MFVSVWKCCLLSLLLSLETALCQLHGAKCHSVFPLPWKHLPLQCLPAEEYTHIHTHTQRQAAWIAVIPYLVTESGYPFDFPLLLRPSDKSYTLYLHTLKLSFWRDQEISLREIQLHVCKSHDKKLTRVFFFLLLLSEWRLKATSRPLHPPFSCERRISLQPSDEVATATAGPCATVDVLWPLCRLRGSRGRPSLWQHGHLTLAPNLPSACLGTKTFRRHRCCCTRLLKNTLKRTIKSNYR